MLIRLKVSKVKIKADPMHMHYSCCPAWQPVVVESLTWL